MKVDRGDLFVISDETVVPRHTLLQAIGHRGKRGPLLAVSIPAQGPYNNDLNTLYVRRVNLNGAEPEALRGDLELQKGTRVLVVGKYNLDKK